MTIKVTYDCNGCDASESVTLPGANFDAFNGKGYGFGYIVYPKIRDHVPKGWMDYDPYTYMTYCPACVESIWPEEKAESIDAAKAEGHQ